MRRVIIRLRRNQRHGWPRVDFDRQLFAKRSARRTGSISIGETGKDVLTSKPDFGFAADEMIVCAPGLLNNVLTIAKRRRLLDLSRNPPAGGPKSVLEGRQAHNENCAGQCLRLQTATASGAWWNGWHGRRKPPI